MEMLSVVHNLHVWLNLTENWIYNQVRHLPDDIKSYVVCKTLQNEDQFPWPHIECVSRERRRRYLYMVATGSLALRRRLRGTEAYLCYLAQKHDVAVFHSHFGYIGWRYMEMIRRLRRRHIVSFYGFDLSRLPKEDPIWMDRYQDMFAAVDKILCEGPHMAACVEALGCPKEKIQIQHLGVDVQNIAFRPRRWPPNESLRVLIAASFRQKKGIPLAIKALGKIQKKVNLEVTIIGDATAAQKTQDEKRLILKVIEQYDLHTRIRMLGFQPLARLREEAYRHHVFLSPSMTCEDGDTEGGAPVSLIEMAATGMPIVSTKHCDIPHVIEDGVGGLLADERDVKGLVERLEWLIDHPQQWETMTVAARQRMEKEFNIRTQAIHLGDIYKTML